MNMKKIGISLLAVGFLWGIYAYTMSVSVEVGGETIGSGIYSIHIPKTKVNNLGLMDERRNHVIGAGFTLFIGVILLIVGIVRPEEETENTNKEISTPPKIEINDNVIGFYVEDSEDFEMTCRQIISRYKKNGYDRMVVNTVNQLVIQKNKNSFIKVRHVDDLILIESENSPKIDIAIIQNRKKYIQESKEIQSDESKVNSGTATTNQNSNVKLENKSTVEELTNLVELKKSGVITNEQYEALKQQIMGAMQKS